MLIALSILGLLASSAISIEKTHLLKDPSAVLSCSLNPVYSCQSVITSPQASVFGFSNEIIGIAFFGGMIAVGLGLLAGAKYKQWFHSLVWLGLLGSMVMVVWFFWESVYEINALCIYCSTVWVATWSSFIGYSKYMLDYKLVSTKKNNRYVAFFNKNYLMIWLSLILIFAGLILHHFWSYYGQYFGY